MTEPSRLQLKRRCTEEAPEYLVLQGSIPDAAPVRYVKKQKNDEPAASDSEAARFARSDGRTTLAPKRQRDLSKRIFHLQVDAPQATTGKRKGRDDPVAIFVEQKPKKSRRSTPITPLQDLPDQLSVIEPPTTTKHKPPGSGLALKKHDAKPAVAPPVRPEPQGESHDLLDYMQQMLVEEIEREQRQKPVVVPPKISAARSRQIHQQRVASNAVPAANGGGDVDMDTEDEYEYDEYVRVAFPGQFSLDQQQELDNTGYLVISPDQQTAWESYLENEQEDKEAFTDDEDENAEDYYGADYPEDEVSSDDEFDRNLYGYNATVDDGWDEDTGAYSDEEFSDMMNPFGQKASQRLAKALRGEYDAIEHL